MSLVQWNIRGFSSNREQVRALFNEQYVSAVCLQETKIGVSTPNVGSNFVLYRSPPMIGVRAQGGTAIMIRKSVNHKVIQLLTELQACAVQIFTNKWVTLC